MIYIYNEHTDTYTDLYRQAFENLEEYLGPEVEDITIYQIMFFMSLDDIFTQAKKRSAFRGRFAKDAQGKSLLESLAITDDEKTFLEDLLPVGATEVFKKLSAWMKNHDEPYQFGVSFGAKAPSGTVTIDSGTVISDSTSPFSPGALTGYKLVILSGTINGEEREIQSNTASDLTIDRPFTSSSLGLLYGVYNPNEKFITYALEMELNWHFAMIQAAEAAIKEALVAFELKEWYLANRYMDDFAREEARYQKELGKVRSALFQGKESWKRPTDFFAGSYH
jgi:hypothetical protein